MRLSTARLSSLVTGKKQGRVGKTGASKRGDDAKDVTPERPVIIEQSRMPKPIR
jgi:hypothetical protein